MEPDLDRVTGAPEGDEGVTWLAVDLHRLKLRECWRMSPSWLVFVPFMLFRLFRMRVPETSAVAREFLWVDRAGSVPAWATALFAGQEPALVSAGLQPVMTYSLRALGPDAPDAIGRVFLDADGRSLTQLMAIPAIANVSAVRLAVTCSSITDDGTLVDTTTVGTGMDPPPATRVEIARGDAATVSRRHRDRIAGVAVVPCAVDGVRARLAEEHARSVAFHEGRGVYVPISAARVAALRAGARSEAPATTAGGPAAPRAAAGPRRFATLGVWVVLVGVLWWVLGGGGDGGGPDGPLTPGPLVGPARQGRQVIEAKASEAQIAEALAPYRARLEASKRPVARVRLVPMPFDDVLASKVGGEPYLPAEESPPRTANGGAMVLLAQINFADVPPMAGYPRTGILQFFIARNDEGDLYGMDPHARSLEARMVQGAFRVRHIEHVDTGATRGRAPPRCGGRCNTPHDPDRPRRMVFALQEEPISASDVDFASVVGFKPYDWVMERAAAWQVDEVDLADRALPTAGGHKLGGYPYFTQDDPRPPGTPLRLLLQLDTDDELMWGDAGVGAFFIDPADLARRDFSRVLYSWDCH